ncbi:MAG TPA: hypothetical protein VI365_21050 [Trebonia sp.]
MTIRKSCRTQLPHHALSRGALAGVAAIALACLATGCSPARSTASAPGTASSAAPASTVARTPASSPTAPNSPASATPPASPTATAAAQPSATASAQPTSSAGTQEVLSPATVPPVDKECTYPVTDTADGNVTPLLCQDGRLNVDAWDSYYASFAGSKLLRLGQGATAATVYQAMCQDISDLHMTMPEAESTEELAQAYYGWNVSASALSLQLTKDLCQSS